MIPFCNVCFRTGQEDPNLFITQCRRVVCKACVLASNGRCAVCHSQCRSIELNKNMPEHMRKYFQDPLKELEELQKVIKFQEDQRAISNGYAKKIMEQHHRLRKSIMEKKREYDRLRKIVAKLQAQDKARSSYRTPGTSLSGFSGSQFSSDMNTTDRRTGTDSSFFRDSPNPSKNSTLSFSLDNL
ncbi:RING finger protein narya-like [Phlebotomus argentipes]|uniref:RING finger protein narya-like n=1 Tax=Phlebotomus argentipes TaxID=94469 RepID=UPI0028930B4A|nr:RING finger protein narya-like [Phlebotomus argentipes]